MHGNQAYKCVGIDHAKKELITCAIDFVLGPFCGLF